MPPRTITRCTDRGARWCSSALAQAELGGWGDLVCVVDDVGAAVEAILQRLPAEVVLPRPPARKR